MKGREEQRLKGEQERGTRAGAARLDKGDGNGECIRSWARKIERGWVSECWGRERT